MWNYEISGKTINIFFCEELFERSKLLAGDLLVNMLEHEAEAATELPNHVSIGIYTGHNWSYQLSDPEVRYITEGRFDSLERVRETVAVLFKLNHAKKIGKALEGLPRDTEENSEDKLQAFLKIADQEITPKSLFENPVWRDGVQYLEKLGIGLISMSKHKKTP